MKVVKILMIGMLIYSFTTLKKYQSKTNQILWTSELKLIWNDFQGKIDTSKTHVAAMTNYEIEITDIQIQNNIPKYKVSCFFIKDKSWTRVSDSVTLSHEQIHFNIAEFFTRKIRKSFDSLNIKKCNDIEKYNEIYRNHGKSCDRYQELYDSNVYFNSINQKKWNKKVYMELAKLNRYK